MSTYSDDRQEAEDNWLDLRIAAYEAARDDYEADDGPYHAGLERES